MDGGTNKQSKSAKAHSAGARRSTALPVPDLHPPMYPPTCAVATPSSRPGAWPPSSTWGTSSGCQGSAASNQHFRQLTRWCRATTTRPLPTPAGPEGLPSAALLPTPSIRLRLSTSTDSKPCARTKAGSKIGARKGWAVLRQQVQKSSMAGREMPKQKQLGCYPSSNHTRAAAGIQDVPRTDSGGQPARQEAALTHACAAGSC